MAYSPAFVPVRRALPFCHARENRSNAKRTVNTDSVQISVGEIANMYKFPGP